MSQGHGSPLSPHPVTSSVAGNRLRGRKGPDAAGRGTAGPPAGVTRPHRGSGSDHLGSAGCSSKPRSDKGRVHPRQRAPSSAPKPHPQASTQTLRGRPPGQPGCGRPSGGGLTARDAALHVASLGVAPRGRGRWQPGFTPSHFAEPAAEERRSPARGGCGPRP